MVLYITLLLHLFFFCHAFLKSLCTAFTLTMVQGTLEPSPDAPYHSSLTLLVQPYSKRVSLKLLSSLKVTGLVLFI